MAASSLSVSSVPNRSSHDPSGQSKTMRGHSQGQIDLPLAEPLQGDQALGPRTRVRVLSLHEMP